MGYTLAEMLVVIALMGIVVSAVLVSLRISVLSSGVDRDNAAAFAWLQAASDEVYRTGRVACTVDGQGRVDAIQQYDASARAAAPPPIWLDSSSPTGLSGAASIAVVDVEYLGRVSVDDDFSWSPSWCFEGVGFEDSPLYTQRVSLEVTFPNGTTVQSLQMVKSQ